ncbi:cyclase family protein [Alkalinema pantanalense CENA528]|uniref:cyclase family protein n=1 Tax=Alkalinema pantanalense TaxID=1620705 RepID=UPI003D6FB38A
MEEQPCLQILDLTKPIDAAIEIYATPTYSDPPFECREWCSVNDQGFRVSELRLGTQTGTHIDAPAHFAANGATLEALSPSHLIGRYFLLDLPAYADLATVTALCQSIDQEGILFIRTPLQTHSCLPLDALTYLLQLPLRLWVLDGYLTIADAPEFAFYQQLAQAGKYWVEDLDRATTQAVQPNGEIFALPLALVGTSGAPCRVLVRQPPSA